MKSPRYLAAQNPGRFAALGLVVSLFVSACGGGGGGTSPSPSPVNPTAKGSLKVAVTWPTSESRVIPTNSKSLRVEVLLNSVVVGSALLVKPNTTVTLNELPEGLLQVRASAYESTDGSGTPLAVAETSATIAADETTSVPVALTSTIASLDASPSSISMAPGANKSVSVTAYDANNAVVPIDPTALTFTVGDPSVATVTSAGVVTAGQNDGQTEVAVRESNSGKSVSIPVVVTSHATISINPSTSRISVGAKQQFSATVSGHSNTAVTWSVVEQNGGTITTGGLYKAPAAKGTYHVKAVSQADSSLSTTVAVTVVSGSADVVIQ